MEIKSRPHNRTGLEQRECQRIVQQQWRVIGSRYYNNALDLFRGKRAILIFLHVFPVDGVVSMPGQETGKGEIAEDTKTCALVLLTSLSKSGGARCHR